MAPVYGSSTLGRMPSTATQLRVMPMGAMQAPGVRLPPPAVDDAERPVPRCPDDLSRMLLALRWAIPHRAFFCGRETLPFDETPGTGGGSMACLFLPMLPGRTWIGEEQPPLA